MDVTDAAGLEVRARELEAALVALTEEALEWAADNLTIHRTFRAALARHADREGFPEVGEDWVDAMEARILLGALLGRPKQVKRFLRDREMALTPEGHAAAERAIVHPWRHTAVSLREPVTGGLVRCVDHDTGEGLFLLSPGMADMAREGAQVFLVLLAEGDGFAVVYSAPQPFLALDPSDIRVFARAVEPGLFDSLGLSAIIRRNPVPFHLLGAYSDVPDSVVEGTRVALCHDWRESEVLPALAHPDRFTSGTRGGLLRLALTTTPEAPRIDQDAYLFHDRRRGRVLARAGSIRRYAELVEAAGPAWGFAPLPRWRCGLVALLAVRSLTRWKDPVAEAAEVFDRRMPIMDTPEYRRANALLREIVKSRAEDAAYSIEELSARHGMEPEQARALEVALDDAMTREARKLGPLGVTELPDAASNRLADPLARSDLFYLDEGEEMAALFAGYAREAAERRPQGGRRGALRALVADGKLGPESLAVFLEDESRRQLGEVGPEVLSCLLYLLIRSHGGVHPVADFVQSLRRLIKLAADADLYPAVERFFTRTLEPLGLVRAETQGEGLVVEATEVLDLWLGPTPLWDGE